MDGEAGSLGDWQDSVMADDRRALLVLLGAGASRPMIPGVEELTEQLLGWDEYRASSADDVTKATPPDSWAFSDIAPLISWGQSDLRTTYFRRLQDVLGAPAGSGTGLNFEGLIHASDELAHVLPHESDEDDHFRWVLSRFFEIRQERSAWGRGRVPNMVGRIGEAARYFILDHVAKKCRDVKGRSPMAEALANLAENFVLRLHSLNYDDLPFAAGIDFYTGFDVATGRFRPRYPWPADLDAFLQLHGSVRWGMVDSEVRAFASLDEAAQARESRVNEVRVHDGHVLPLAPMITGFRKADMVLERPYGTYFHVFREQLLATPRWLIIGYGFGDPHVNRALQQAWANWKDREVRARAVVVDFLAGDRNATEPTGVDTRGWTKLVGVLEKVFKEELMERWRLRNVRKLPGVGLIEVDDARSVAVQLDGTCGAMTTGLADVVSFLSPR